MSNNVKHPPLVVNGGDDFYRHFELEQVGWGVVAKVESVSDFEAFPFMLAAAPEMQEALDEAEQALAIGAQNCGGEEVESIFTAPLKAVRAALAKARNGGLS